MVVFGICICFMNMFNCKLEGFFTDSLNDKLLNRRSMSLGSDFILFSSDPLIQLLVITCMTSHSWLQEPSSNSPTANKTCITNSFSVAFETTKSWQTCTKAYAIRDYSSPLCLRLDPHFPVWEELQWRTIILLYFTSSMAFSLLGKLRCEQLVNHPLP